MDDLLSEFLTETTESLDVIDMELVKFEQDPNNADILDNIFRLVHTIKGTCGFLGLPRLEALAHAAETLMGKYREGDSVTQDGVSLILQSIDRIKEIMLELETNQTEPAGTDDDLIAGLDRISSGGDAAEEASAPESEAPAEATPAPAELPSEPAPPPPKAGEVSLEELEAAFASAPGPEDMDTGPETEAAVEPEVSAEPDIPPCGRRSMKIQQNKKLKNHPRMLLLRISPFA